MVWEQLTMVWEHFQKSGNTFCKFYIFYSGTPFLVVECLFWQWDAFFGSGMPFLVVECLFWQWNAFFCSGMPFLVVGDLFWQWNAFQGLSFFLVVGYPYNIECFGSGSGMPLFSLKVPLLPRQRPQGLFFLQKKHTFLRKIYVFL